MTNQKQSEADRNYAEVMSYFSDLVTSKQVRNRKKTTSSVVAPSFTAPVQPKAPVHPTTLPTKPSFAAPVQPKAPKRNYKFQETANFKIVTIEEIRNEISTLQTKEEKLKVIQGYIDIYLSGVETTETTKLLDQLYELLDEISKNESFSKFSQRVPSNLKYNFANNYELDTNKIPKWEDLLKEIETKPKEEQLTILENWRDVILGGDGNTVSLELLLQIDRYLMQQAKEGK